MVPAGFSKCHPITASDMQTFNDHLDNLCHWTDPHNIFDILRIGGSEIRHSNLLAWLLDPRGTHGFGTFFLERFLSEVRKKRDIGFIDDSCDLSDAVVFRELYSMDIIVKSESSKIIMVIENKIHAMESKDQLDTYQGMVEGAFLSLGFNPIYVFLTVAGDFPSNDEWIDLPYASIYPHLLAMSTMDADERTRTYLEDYIRTIGVEMFMDAELQKVCLEMYKNHARELKLLNDFSVEMFKRRTERIQEILENHPDIEFRMDGSNFIITTPTIRDVNSSLSGDPFGPVFILFINKRPDAGYSTICFMIGPGDDGVRRKCFDHLVNYDLHKSKRAYTSHYSRIYSKYISFNAGYEGLDEWIDNTVKIVSNFLKNDAPKFDEYYSGILEQQREHPRSSHDVFQNAIIVKRASTFYPSRSRRS